jgi:hypothetical protein
MPFSAKASFSFGHNLSSTSETLPQGESTAGTYALGYGLTDQLTIATSPWLIFGYNLNNAIIRYSMPIDLDNEIGHQLAYFDTNTQLGKAYIMKAMSYTATWKMVLDTSYNLYLCGNYMYFWNEKKPFSLRREPFNDKPYQFSLSTLHQFHISEKFVTQFEAGILGLNYTYPFFHGGASLGYFGKAFSYQVGASVSRVGNPNHWEKPEYIDRTAVEGESTEAVSVHPEIQLQAWF